MNVSSSLSVVRDSTDWLPLVSHYWVKQTHCTFYGVAFQVSSEAAYDVVVCVLHATATKQETCRTEIFFPYLHVGLLKPYFCTLLFNLQGPLRSVEPCGLDHLPGHTTLKLSAIQHCFWHLALG